MPSVMSGVGKVASGSLPKVPLAVTMLEASPEDFRGSHEPEGALVEQAASVTSRPAAAVSAMILRTNPLSSSARDCITLLVCGGRLGGIRGPGGLTGRLAQALVAGLPIA